MLNQARQPADRIRASVVSGAAVGAYLYAVITSGRGLRFSFSQSGSIIIQTSPLPGLVDAAPYLLAAIVALLVLASRPRAGRTGSGVRNGAQRLEARRLPLALVAAGLVGLLLLTALWISAALTNSTAAALPPLLQLLIAAAAIVASLAIVLHALIRVHTDAAPLGPRIGAMILRLAMTLLGLLTIVAAASGLILPQVVHVACFVLLPGLVTLLTSWPGWC